MSFCSSFSTVALAIRALAAIALLSFGAALYSAAGYKTSYVVAADGSGDFRSLQAAIDDCKSFPDEWITIRVKDGEYRERVTIPSWNPRLRIVGEGAARLVYDEHFKRVGRGRNSTFMTATLEVLANDVRVEGLTVENAAGPVGQALALRVEGDRCVFVDCRFLGNQDTVYAAGEGSRQFFENCYIEGTTDFVFGEATAYFQGCELRSKEDSFVTAASTPEGVTYGLVFRDCRLTAAPGVSSVYLGRPWRAFAKTVLVDCYLGPHIVPEGWGAWGREQPGQTVFYAELASHGPGARPTERVDWAHQLAASERTEYSVASVFGDWDPRR